MSQGPKGGSSGLIALAACRQHLPRVPPLEGTHPARTPGRARWCAAKRLGSDGGLGLLVRLPIPGKKISDCFGRVIWKASEHVGEPGLGIDVVHLAGFDQGIDSGGTISASI